MIQLTRDNNIYLLMNSFYLNLYDEMTSIEFPPLVEFKSQMTNEIKLFLPYQFTSENFTNKERYLRLRVIMKTAEPSGAVPGIIFMGTTEFPYGFYDVNIYQNSSADNLDPDGLTRIYTGLMNLISLNNNAVTYTEYNTNDTDTDSVYITN